VSSIALRPRSATEIVDASFQLMRQYYPQFVALVAIAVAPYLLLRIVLGSGVGSPPVMLAQMLVNWLCTAVSEAAIIVAVSDSYLEGRVDIARALGQTLSKLLWIVGAGIARGALVLLASLLFIIPGAYVALRTFAVMPVVMLEHGSPNRAIERAWGLGKGQVSRILVTLGLAWLIYLALFFFIGAVVGTGLGRHPVLTDVLTAVIVAFVYPFIGVVTTLLYYDLRVRKEGFDLEVMARELALPVGQ
jgi:hypothetical protein